MSVHTYDQQLKQQEQHFNEKLQELRRFSGATPAKTTYSVHQHMERIGPAPSLERAPIGGELMKKGAADIGEELFTSLIQSSPLINSQFSDQNDNDTATVDSEEASSSKYAAELHQKEFKDGISKEFFHDLVATPVDHLTADRGGLGNNNLTLSSLQAQTYAVELAGKQPGSSPHDLGIAHLSEALHLQRRTTHLLHEIERTAPSPLSQQQTHISDAHLRNEDYMTPGYEYQSAAVMNQRRAAQEALKASNTVRQKAVNTMAQQVRNTAAAIERMCENSTYNEPQHDSTNESENISVASASVTHPVLRQELQLEKAKLTASNVRLQKKLYLAGLSILNSITSARDHSSKSRAFRIWVYFITKHRLTKSIHQVQRYTQRARAVAKFGLLLSAHSRWKILSAWKHWCAVTQVQSHETHVQKIWHQEMKKMLRQQQLKMDKMRRHYQKELQEGAKQQQNLKTECKAVAEASLSMRRVGDERRDTAVAAMRAEMQDTSNTQSLRFRTELDDLKAQHEAAVKELANQQALHLKQQDQKFRAELDMETRKLQEQEALTQVQLRQKDAVLREHVTTLQKRHGELLELTISDHDQQIKALVSSLKSHATTLEDSARDKIAQILEECAEKEQAAMFREQEAVETAVQKLQTQVQERQQQLMDAHHEQLQEQEQLRLAMLTKQQQLVKLHGQQVENLKHSEAAALARAAEKSRVMQIHAEEQFHEDLHAIVSKSKNQQDHLLSTFEVQHVRQTDEILSNVAVKQSEKLSELIEKCEERINAEKLASSNEVARIKTELETSEVHALQVQEMQLANDWRLKLQNQKEVQKELSEASQKKALEAQAASHTVQLKDLEASLARRFAQAQQLLVDEIEMGRDQSIINTTKEQQKALQEVVQAAQKQKQAYEDELSQHRAALKEAKDELRAQAVAHDSLKADVTLKEASEEQANRSAVESKLKGEKLRDEIKEQYKTIQSLAGRNQELLSTRRGILAQDALQHLSMTMIERSISVRGLFERLDQAQAGWLDRDEFINGMQMVFPAAPKRLGGPGGTAAPGGDGSSLFTVAQLEALFVFMDQFGTQKVSWEAFAQSFTDTTEKRKILPNLSHSFTADTTNVKNLTRTPFKNHTYDADNRKTSLTLGEEKTSEEASRNTSTAIAAALGGSPRGQRLLIQMRLKTIEQHKLDRIKARLRAQAYRHTDLGGWDLNRLFTRRDRNHDGTLDFDEFLATVRKELRLPAHEISNEDVEDLFNVLDFKASGQLSVDQLHLLLGDHLDTSASANAGEFPQDLDHNRSRILKNSTIKGSVQANQVLSPRGRNGWESSEENNISSRISQNKNDGKWTQRISFLMKLYRMNVLNDKVLQKLSDRDLQRSLQAVQAALNPSNAQVIQGVDKILSDALRGRGYPVPEKNTEAIKRNGQM